MYVAIIVGGSNFIVPSKREYIACPPIEPSAAAPGPPAGKLERSANS